MSEFDLPLSRHMVAAVYVLSPDERLPCAARRMTELGVSALPVVDARQRLIGVLDRTELLRVGRLRARPEPGESPFWWPDLSVAECMQTTVPVAPPERSLRQCARHMLDRALHRMYVLADAQLVGVLSTRELMHAVQHAGLATPIAELSVRPAQTIAATAPLSAAWALLESSAEQALLVLANGAPAGVFARAQLRACLEVDPAQPTAPYSDVSLIVLDGHVAAASAAQQALAARARYIIAHPPGQPPRIIAGLSFASCICGGAPALQPAAEVLSPALGISASEPRRAPSVLPEPPRLVPAPLPASRASTLPLQPPDAAPITERSAEHARGEQGPAEPLPPRQRG